MGEWGHIVVRAPFQPFGNPITFTSVYSYQETLANPARYGNPSRNPLDPSSNLRMSGFRPTPIAETSLVLGEPSIGLCKGLLMGEGTGPPPQIPRGASE